MSQRERSVMVLDRLSSKDQFGAWPVHELLARERACQMPGTLASAARVDVHRHETDLRPTKVGKIAGVQDDGMGFSSYGPDNVSPVKSRSLVATVITSKRREESRAQSLSL